jgi:hypothetical protein
VNHRLKMLLNAKTLTGSFVFLKISWMLTWAKM